MKSSVSAEESDIKMMSSHSLWMSLIFLSCNACVQNDWDTLSCLLGPMSYSPSASLMRRIQKGKKKKKNSNRYYKEQ